MKWLQLTYIGKSKQEICLIYFWWSELNTLKLKLKIIVKFIIPQYKI